MSYSSSDGDESDNYRLPRFCLRKERPKGQGHGDVERIESPRGKTIRHPLLSGDGLPGYGGQRQSDRLVRESLRRAIGLDGLAQSAADDRSLAFRSPVPGAL